MKCLIIGCGYLGSCVVNRWMSAGDEVAALTRSLEKAERLRDQGLQPLVGDVTDAGSLRSLPAADVMLYAVANDWGNKDRRTAIVGGLENVLNAVSGKCSRIVFVSTSSVYGQCAGEWIDEQSETQPVTEAGRIALEAEDILRERRDFDSMILRLTGLYGPGRLLRRIDQLRSGEPIAGEGEAWLNLIHVDDAASAVEGAATSLMKNSTLTSAEFLISDDFPVRRSEYYGHLAQLVGAARPQFDMNLQSRISGLGKRCRNEAAKRDLGLTLRYPTYLKGLSVCLPSSEVFDG